VHQCENRITATANNKLLLVYVITVRNCSSYFDPLKVVYLNTTTCYEIWTDKGSFPCRGMKYPRHHDLTASEVTPVSDLIRIRAKIRLSTETILTPTCCSAHHFQVTYQNYSITVFHGPLIEKRIYYTT